MGATPRLGQMQQRVLDVLAMYPDPPTAAEIAPAVYLPFRNPVDRRPTTEAENVAATLGRLARRGLVERLGTAANGGRCWRITAAGVEVTAQIRRGGRS